MWYFDDLDCILVRLFLLCELYIENSFFIHLKKYVKALEYQNLMIHVIMIKSYLKFFFYLANLILKKNCEFQIWNPDGFHGTSRGRGGKITSLLCHQGMCETLKIKMIFILQAYPPPSPVNKNWTFLLYDSAGLFDIDFWI